MLRKQAWMRRGQDILVELKQSMEEGKDVRHLEERFNEASNMESTDPGKDLLAEKLYAEVEKAAYVPDYQYMEPSDLEGIRKARPVNQPELRVVLSDSDLYARVHGAWLGRVAGCLLGKPIEGWRRPRLYGLLKETGNYPIFRYISSEIDPVLIQKYDVLDTRAWINKIHGAAPIDDDTNYTVLGLKILEAYGKDFTPEDVGEAWLSYMPMLSTCTAERVAYRNLAAGLYPPETAIWHNPYREWIGAQIRADFFGYVNPGNIEKAAEYAWRDACISHIKNGIYGEMFVAAMLAAAPVCLEMQKVIEAGLSQVPEKSRLAEKVQLVLSWYRDGVTWEQAIEKIHAMYDENSGHDWCHTISNAMIVCVGLLYGEKDFEKSICIAVMGVLDTDCNGATVGSIVGMMMGVTAIPEKWSAPLNDSLLTSIRGYELVKISEMAAKTMELVRQQA